MLQFGTFVCSSTNCSANINVYNGVSKNSSLLATIRADQPLPVLISSGRFMLLEYITDPSTPSSFNGSYSSGMYPTLVCIIWSKAFIHCALTTCEPVCTVYTPSLPDHVSICSNLTDNYCIMEKCIQIKFYIISWKQKFFLMVFNTTYFFYYLYRGKKQQFKKK